MTRSVIKHRLLGVHKYIQLHSLLHLGKRINGKDLWTKNSEASLGKKVSYGDGMSEARTIQFMSSIKKIRNKIRNKTRLVERKHQNDIAVAIM